MTDLSPEFCQKVKEARREAGISQSVLAEEVGCKQSALSMFEKQCDGTKLSDEAIEKLAQKFNLKITTVGGEGSAKGTSATPAAHFVRVVREPHTGYCPNPDCPGHQRYQIEAKVYLKPDRAAQDPVGGKFCALCGEVLERKCPTCGAPVHAGAICSFCGEPYVAN